MLTNDALERMRAVRTAALPDRADIRRRGGANPNPGSDDFGSSKQTAGAPVTVATAVPCRLQNPRSLEARQVAAKLTDHVILEAVLAAGADVRFGDELVIAGVAYSVRAVLSPEGAWETARTVVVSRAHTGTA